MTAGDPAAPTLPGAPRSARPGGEPPALRVAFADFPPEAVRRVAAEALPDFDLRLPEDDTPAAVEAALRGADALIARRRPLGARELRLAGRTRLVVALGRNPTAVRERAVRAAGAALIAVPHPGAIAVADHTLALLLAAARRIVEGDRGVRAGDYRRLSLEPKATTERSFAFHWLRGDEAFPEPFLLDGRTLGLVGFGAIGQEVARRAPGFGMRARYFMRQPLSAGWNRRLGVEAAPSLEALLAESDLVSLHLPHTEVTENLLDAAALDRMKPGAVLVNTARGGLVDEAALAERLRDGRLGGAGLDVFREEPLPAGHPLADAPRTVLAPHTGGAGAGGQRELFARAADAIREFFADGRAAPRPRP